MADVHPHPAGLRHPFEAVGSRIAEGVLVLDQDRRLLYINQVAADLFQVDKKSAMGTVLQTLVPAAEVEQAVEAVFLQQTDLARTVLHGGKWLELTLAYLAGLEGGAGQVLLVFNDVTRVRQLERVRSDFVANASHELKTPIAAILGIVETVLDDRDMQSKTRRRFIERIRRQTLRMNMLVTDLLMLSRLDAIDRVTDSEPVCLNQLVLELYDSLLDDAEDRGLHLGVQLPDEDVYVDGDAKALDQLIKNLLDNAIEYSEPGRKVVLRLGALAQMVSIQVQDEGIGIKREDQERIFERFFQVDKARSRKSPSTGLGLSIVKHVARAHGGDVKVESRFGFGSTFTVRIPLRSNRAMVEMVEKPLLQRSP